MHASYKIADLYRRTALNLLVGKWYFHHCIAHKQKNPKTIILSFDPDETSDMDKMPYLLDMLKKYRMKGSFAAVGIWVERYPQLWKRVVKEGHEIINHTYSHPDNPQLNPKHYSQLTRSGRKEEISKCHAVVKKILGVRMQGFRTPHFGYQHTQDTYDILSELGYTFSSSTLAIDSPDMGRPFVTRGITEFPLSYCPTHPWALFDSSHAFRAHILHHSPAAFLHNFDELLDSGVFVNIYLDPQDFTRYDFEDILRTIRRKHFQTMLYRDFMGKAKKVRVRKS